MPGSSLFRPRNSISLAALMLGMRGKQMLTAALAVSALAAAQPAGAQQPAPSLQQPAVVLSYYSARQLPNIVRALGAAGLPTATPVFYGNYFGTSAPKKP